MPASSSLSDVRLALVGPGRVGTSLARWAVDRGADLVAVVGRSMSRGEPAAPETVRLKTTRRLTFDDLDASASVPCDVLLVAVSDAALVEVAERLAGASAALGRATPGQPAPVALHTSGIHDAAALAPLAAVGWRVGSLHPLMAFPRPLADPGPRPPLFAVDGDGAGLETARRLAASFGGRAFEIAGRRRLLYHLAATVAAGGLTTLMAVVEEILERSDLPSDLLPAYFDLAVGALEEARGSRPIDDAVTGPAARGDRTTVARQLAALRQVAPRLTPVVEAVHGETFRRLGHLEETARDRGEEPVADPAPTSSRRR